MNRREFLSLSIPAGGAVLLAPGLAGEVFAKEINRQFAGRPDFDSYDVLINGGGLGGYFAALHAANQGKRVLLVEKRSALGYELTAKGQLWLGADGFEDFPEELKQLFVPEGEASEVHNKNGSGAGGSLFGDNLLLLAGSIKKGLLRNLLVNKVDILLMSDVCGLFSSGKRVTGALIASKHGVHTVKCHHFIDASDNLQCSRAILGEPFRPTSASFVLEIWKAKNATDKTVPVSNDFGITGNSVRFQRGKHSEGQLFLSYEFPARGLTVDDIEQRARNIAESLGKNLPGIDPSLSGAQIYQFAWECGYNLGEQGLPAPVLNNHHLLGKGTGVNTCREVLELQAQARTAVNGLEKGSTANRFDHLRVSGVTVPASQLALSPLGEPGLAIPLSLCQADWGAILPEQQDFQVVVAGGGTAGSMAAIGAVEKGAKTVVVDFFNDLGGTKTMGGVMGYYHGVRSQRYFKQQDAEANQLASSAKMTNKLGRMLYLRNALSSQGARFIGGTILCGSVMREKKLQGILVCQNGSLKVLRGDIMIDGTGDGDLAAFSGATFKHGDGRSWKTQNYSQWNIRGAGKMPSNTNGDYDIIDNTKISEVQRGLFLSHYEAHFYDFYAMLAVRESRRIDGLYELNLIDAVEGTRFPDVVCLASSDFDPHYVGITEYTRCGFLLPHSNDIVTEIPYRSLVPKGIDGLLISGRGFSQTHNAMQFTRMTADLIVLGYLTGQMAADMAWKGQQPREYDITGIQREWDDLGYYPEEYFKKPVGRKMDASGEASKRVHELAAGKREYLYEVVKLPKEKAVPLLEEAFGSVSAAPSKLLLAKALAWFGKQKGNELIAEELETLFKEEQAKGHDPNFVDNYDLIRGREHNVLEGHFWRINQNIALLAMSGNAQFNGLIDTIIGKTTSGGGMMKRESDYYDERIDLKLVPFHNRILNLCFYAERLPDPRFIPSFTRLLDDKHIGGYLTTEYHETRWRLYGGDLELFIGAAIARCGGEKGYKTLVDYLGDIHYNFKRFAASELKELTGQDHGYDPGAWTKQIARLSYPRPPRALVKTVEL